MKTLRKSFIAFLAAMTCLLMGSAVCQAATSYQLSILGKEIVRNGAVVGTCPAGFSYDHNTRTITMDSVNCTLSGERDPYGFSECTVIEAMGADIKIVLKGNNVFYGPSKMLGEIFSNMDRTSEETQYWGVHISGPGSLKAAGTEPPILGYAGKTTISNCSIQYQAPNQGYIGHILDANEDLSIVNSTILVEGSSERSSDAFGILDTRGNLSIQNSNITMTLGLEESYQTAINCWKDARIVDSNITLKAIGTPFYNGIKVVENSYKPSEGKAVCTIQNSKISITNTEAPLVARKFNILGDYRYFLDNKETTKDEFFFSEMGYLRAGSKEDLRMEPGKAQQKPEEPAKPGKKTPIKKIKITGDKIATAGTKIQLKVKIKPGSATNKNLKWTSSNKKVATVNDKGVVTLKKKSGGKSVTITAKAKDGSGKKASITIKSRNPVQSIKIVAPKKIKAGKTQKLEAIVKGKSDTLKKVKWTVDNKKYAKITDSGKLKIKKAGKGKKIKVTAAATDGSGVKKTVTIKIK